MADYPKNALKAASALWMGAAKSHVAKTCGITTAELRTWMQADWWPGCTRQAEAQHFTKLLGTARNVLQTTMDAGLDPEATARDRKQALDAARFLLERRDASFAPPGTQHTVKHEHGPLQLEARLSNLSVEELRALAQNPAKALPAPAPELTDAEFEDVIDMIDTATPNRPPAISESDDGTLYLDD